MMDSLKISLHLTTDEMKGSEQVVEMLRNIADSIEVAGLPESWDRMHLTDKTTGNLVGQMMRVTNSKERPAR